MSRRDYLGDDILRRNDGREIRRRYEVDVQLECFPILTSTMTFSIVSLHIFFSRLDAV